MIAPIQNISFGSKNIRPADYMKKAVFGEGKHVEDNFSYSPKNDIEALVGQDNFALSQKYDIACQVAAYYKTQYEKLAKNGCCIA